MTTEIAVRMLPAGYLDAAATTAVYSPQWSVVYPALGLGNEVAELVEKVEAGAPANDVLAELGDVLWYVAALARDARIMHDELFWTVRPGMPLLAAHSMNKMVMAAGAAQGHVKKALRDHDGDLDARRGALQSELALLLHSADDIATYYGSTIDVVAAANLAKLASRAARNTLQGDGDVR